jgi:hypothetical protein
MGPICIVSKKIVFNAIVNPEFVVETERHVQKPELY